MLWLHIKERHVLVLFTTNDSSGHHITLFNLLQLTACCSIFLLGKMSSSLPYACLLYTCYDPFFYMVLWASA